MRTRAAAGVLLVLLTLPPTVAAQAPGDERLRDAVTRAVRTYARLTIFDAVTAHVSDGEVTLHGKVTLREKRDDLTARVRDLAGVRRVHNRIELLQSSGGDEALRTRTARAIYGNPTFWRYAALPHPPIRILVEQGRVTLTGVVATESERVLAQSLATAQSALEVSNHLQVDIASR